MARIFFSFLGAMLAGILAVFVADGPIAARVAAYFVITETAALIALTVTAVIAAFGAFLLASTMMSGGNDEELANF